MCCAGVGTLPAHEMTTGRVSHQQINRIKGQIVIYRPSIGPDSLRDALRATFVGNHRVSSGEFRFRWAVHQRFTLFHDRRALRGSCDEFHPFDRAILHTKP